MGLIKDKGMVYKAVDDLDLGPESNEEYLKPNVKAPRMAGFLVKSFVWLIELRIIGAIVIYFLKKNNLIHKLVTFAELQEPPLFMPLHSYDKGVEAEETIQVEYDTSPAEQVQHAMECLKYPERIMRIPDFAFYRWTLQDYSRAYISGKLTPTLENKYQFLMEFQLLSRMRWIAPHIRQQVAQNGYIKIARNPYDARKVTGGSSSGSAAVVAAGLCPVALGVDGGGSVRLPAALSGVIGFKPSFGRVSPAGVLPLNWTVGMVGILAATVEDALIVYAAISGEAPTHKLDNKMVMYQFSISIYQITRIQTGRTVKKSRAKMLKWSEVMAKDHGQL